MEPIEEHRNPWYYYVDKEQAQVYSSGSHRFPLKHRAYTTGIQFPGKNVISANSILHLTSPEYGIRGN